MGDVAELLKQGWQFHQEGQHSQAEPLYREAVTANPRHPTAHYLLGKLALDRCQHDTAIDELTQAVRLDSSKAVYHAELAQALQAAGRLREAVESYRTSLILDPADAPTLVNLGNTLLQAGDLKQAMDCYQQALQRDPGLADAHSCLGVIFERSGHLQNAIDCYRRALALRGDYAMAHYNLGNALKKDNRPSEAFASLQAAVRLKPDWGDAHNNLAGVLERLYRYEEAKSEFERAIELEPANAKFHSNLGSVLKDLGHAEAALASYDESLRHNPDDADARCSRSMTLLTLGRFKEGWAQYEHRRKCSHFDSTLDFPQPTWDGSPLGSRTLLIHAEQGLGDTIQFIRYVKLARERGEKVIVAVQPTLIPLLKQSGFENLIAKEPPFPDFDVHAPLLSLPHIFNTEVETIPREVPYLSASPELIEKWRGVLNKIEGFKIGIAWQGSPAYSRDRFRSIPLRWFEALASVPGARLISLQRAAGVEQIAEVADRFPVATLDNLDAEGGVFMDSAAVIKNLDLVIGADTAVPHLAGALAMPAWTVLDYAPEWRQMRGRDESPWYPTVRLFRQSKADDWSPVFEQMAAELTKLVEAKSGK